MYYIGHMGYFAWLWMVIFWVAFVWLIVWLINKNKDPEKRETPLQILKERYAKGEITKKQYDEMKKEIQ